MDAERKPAIAASRLIDAVLVAIYLWLLLADIRWIPVLILILANAATLFMFDNRLRRWPRCFHRPWDLVLILPLQLGCLVPVAVVADGSSEMFFVAGYSALLVRVLFIGSPRRTIRRGRRGSRRGAP